MPSDFRVRLVVPQPEWARRGRRAESSTRKRHLKGPWAKVQNGACEVHTDFCIMPAYGFKNKHSTSALSFAALANAGTAWLRVGDSEQNAVLVRLEGNDLSRSHQNEGLYRHKNGWRHLKRFFVLPQPHGWAVLSQVELGTSWGTTQFPAYCESIFRLLLKIAVGWGTRCVYINFWNHFSFNIYKTTRSLPTKKRYLTFWT